MAKRWRVLRISWVQLERRPAWVAGKIRAGLAG
jgi:hypothetical protein